jgi:hypothetical protein
MKCAAYVAAPLRGRAPVNNVSCKQEQSKSENGTTRVCFACERGMLQLLLTVRLLMLAAMLSVVRSRAQCLPVQLPGSGARAAHEPSLQTSAELAKCCIK